MSAPNPSPTDSSPLTPRDRKKAATWRRIRTAAREIFEEEGFSAACLDKVAQRAGVAKGTLYRHVDSKADLYIEVLLSGGLGHQARLADAAAGEGCAADRLRKLAEFHIEFFMGRQPDPSRIFWAIDNQSVIGEIDPARLARVQALFEESLGILAGVIQEGVDSGEFVPCDPWLIANVIWTLGDRFFELSRSPARRKLLQRPLIDVYREGLDMMLRALVAR